MCAVLEWSFGYSPPGGHLPDTWWSFNHTIIAMPFGMYVVDSLQLAQQAFGAVRNQDFPQGVSNN